MHRKISRAKLTTIVAKRLNSATLCMAINNGLFKPITGTSGVSLMEISVVGSGWGSDLAQSPSRQVTCIVETVSLMPKVGHVVFQSNGDARSVTAVDDLLLSCDWISIVVVVIIGDIKTMPKCEK
jgi:hypothetical protein